MLVALSFCGCSTTASYENCPVYPYGGEKVARELENLSYEDYKNTWEWIARINKLKQELDLCK